MKVRIVNRKKFVISLSIFLCVAISFISSIFNMSFSKENIKYKEKYISKGDTLWGIARMEKEKNSYFNGKEIREVIYEIKETNNLKDSNINEGESIWIPTI